MESGLKVGVEEQSRVLRWNCSEVFVLCRSSLLLLLNADLKKKESEREKKRKIERQETEKSVCQREE